MAIKSTKRASRVVSWENCEMQKRRRYAREEWNRYSWQWNLNELASVATHQKDIIGDNQRTIPRLDHCGCLLCRCWHAALLFGWNIMNVSTVKRRQLTSTEAQRCDAKQSAGAVQRVTQGSGACKQETTHLSQHRPLAQRAPRWWPRGSFAGVPLHRHGQRPREMQALVGHHRQSTTPLCLLLRSGWKDGCQCSDRSMNEDLTPHPSYSPRHWQSLSSNKACRAHYRCMTRTSRYFIIGRHVMHGMA